jgi:hypothetical protein
LGSAGGEEMTTLSVKTDYAREEDSANRKEELIAKLDHGIEERWLATLSISELTKQAVEALHHLNLKSVSSQES